jgi:MFS family permease
MAELPEAKSAQLRDARNFIVLMGVVAMFGDMTYEGARGLVGPYLGLLGASALSVGFVAGLGEFLGYGLRLFTGWLSDRTRAYWPLVIAGYAMNFVVVTGLALAGSWQSAALFVLLERIGKAIRSPARSTLVSYAAQHAGVGASFGLEEALDQLGAVSGPLLTALMLWNLRSAPSVQSYHGAFWLLLLPVLLNLGTVLFARRKFPSPETFEPQATPARPDLGKLFLAYVAAASLWGLGFADWALLSFHAAKRGVFAPDLLPVVYAGAMAVDAVAALAFGHWFDRYGLRVLAASSLLSALFAPFAFLDAAPWSLLLGSALWAIGMGAQDSIFKAAIATLVPKEQRGRAYGWFFAIFGGAWWIGSTAMGYLYERSILGLVVFSVTTQLAAAPLFWLLHRRLRA